MLVEFYSSLILPYQQNLSCAREACRIVIVLLVIEIQDFESGLYFLQHPLKVIHKTKDNFDYKVKAKL